MLISLEIWLNSYKLCITDKDYKFSYTRLVEIQGAKLSTLKNIDALTNNIAKDKSHLTLKIRQMMNVIKSRFFDIETITIKESSFDSKLYSFHISLSIEEYITLKNNRLNNLKKDKDDPMEFIPTVFGIVNLFVKDAMNNVEDSSFKTLSSGEQQLLLSLQTIYYHLYNLNSVDKSQGKTKYSNVCIIIDEVELYFHPEFQRKFVSELIQGLNKMSIKNIKSLNIIFSTHSPFILSDIPSQNILRLANGEPSKQNNQQSFAANIHDLLTNDFFMDSTLGKFSEDKIQTILSFYNRLRISDKTKIDKLKTEYKKNRNEFYSIVKLIGDDVIKQLILNHLKYIDDEFSIIDITDMMERKEHYLKMIELIEKDIDNA